MFTVSEVVARQQSIREYGCGQVSKARITDIIREALPHGIRV